jgi:hypothetical protein
VSTLTQEEYDALIRAQLTDIDGTLDTVLPTFWTLRADLDLDLRYLYVKRDAIDHLLIRAGQTPTITAFDGVRVEMKDLVATLTTLRNQVTEALVDATALATVSSSPRAVVGQLTTTAPSTVPPGQDPSAWAYATDANARWRPR